MEEKRYLGIDWGEKRIGLALADSELKIPSPFKTVGSFKELSKTIEEETPDVLVVGNPIKMSREKDPVSLDFRKFFEKLKDEFSSLEIFLVDERLTSKAGDRLPGDKKTKAGRDEIAAMIILADFLENN